MTLQVPAYILLLIFILLMVECMSHPTRILPWAKIDALWAHAIVGVDPDPANAAKVTQWCKGSKSLKDYAHLL